ncbi:5'-nucleotidase domain-containing protein 1-like [Glandiceps talaboti]
MAADDSFSFADVDVVGFDLDHTICKYKLNEVFPLIYNSLASYLVNERGYDKSLLEPLEIDKDFITKGLVFDPKTGDFIKFSETGYILKASHGSRLLSDDEIHAEYGEERKHPLFDELKKTLNQTDDIRYFENYFDMPGAVLLARIVDLTDKKEGKRPKKYTFLPEIWSSYGRSFNRENFAANRGQYFPPVKESPEKYFHLCSEDLKMWIKRLKDAGKRTFLCTTSNVDYARFLLEFIIGSDWQSYFDVCCMYARKPGFFTHSQDTRPFYNLDVDKETDMVTTLLPDNIYSQGNAQSLLTLLKKLTGKEKPKVVYIGDSLRSDVFPMAPLDWNAVLILEEMEAEGLISNSHSDQHNNDSGDTDDPAPKRKKYTLPNELEVEFLLSSHWGSFFRTPSNTKTTHSDQINHNDDEKCNGIAAMNTLWGYFIKTYSTIAVPHLDYITDLPLDHQFPTFSVEKNRSGFYPALPKALV